MKHKRTVARKLIRQGLCTDLDAEDIAMVAIERACRREAAVDGSPGKTWTWVWRAARNLAIDAWRKRTRARAEFETVDMENDPRLLCPGPQTARALRNAAGRLKQAVAKLDPLQQECVRLKYEEGLSIADIERQTGLPRHKVKTALLKAGRRLRAELDDTHKLMMEALAERH